MPPPFGRPGNDKSIVTVDSPLSDSGATRFPKITAHREYRSEEELRLRNEKYKAHQRHLIRAIQELLESSDGHPDIDVHHYNRLIERVQLGQPIPPNNYHYWNRDE